MDSVFNNASSIFPSKYVFVYSKNLVNNYRKLIGFRFCAEIYSNIYVDIPVSYFLNQIDSKNLCFKDLFDKLSSSGCTYKYFVNFFNRNFLELKFDSSKTIENIVIEDDFTSENEDAFSFYYPNAVVRYINKNVTSTDRGWRNLAKFFKLIFETDFIERFDISEVPDILYGFNGRTFFLDCDSRIFKDTYYDPNCEIFHKLIGEFNEKYGDRYLLNPFVNRDMVEGTIQIGIDLGWNFAKEDDSIISNDFIFDCVTAVNPQNNMLVHQKSKRNCVFTQGFYGDNPFGIRINVRDKTYKVNKDILGIINSKDLKIVNRCYCFGKKKFAVMPEAIPDIPTDILSDMYDVLKKAFESKDMEPYTDCILSFEKRYNVFPGALNDLWFQLDIVSRIDPDAFGHVNSEALIELLEETFCDITVSGDFICKGNNEVVFSVCGIID